MIALKSITVVFPRHTLGNGVMLYVFLVLICAGCINSGGVAAGDTVSVYYTLTVEGDVVDSNAGKQPFTFIVGSGQVIPGFDIGVIGMKVGEEKTFTVSPKEGYGETGSHPLAGKTLIFKIKVVDVKKK